MNDEIINTYPLGIAYSKFSGVLLTNFRESAPMPRKVHHIDNQGNLNMARKSNNQSKKPVEPVLEAPTQPVIENPNESPSDYLVDVLDLTLNTYTQALTPLSALAGSEAAEAVIDSYQYAFDNRLQQRFAEFVPSVSSALRTRFERIAENNQARSARRTARLAEIRSNLQLPEVAIVGNLPYWESEQ